MRLKTTQGFSLIELMITVAIIGVLAAIAVPSYQTYVEKAQISNLVNIAQNGQNQLVEHIVSTGDTSCLTFNTYKGPFGGNPNIQLQIGNVTGFGCVSLAAELNVAGSGTLVLVGYAAVVKPDNSIGWECISAAAGIPSSNLQNIVPTGCTILSF